MRRSTWITLVVFVLAVAALLVWQRQQAAAPEPTPTPGPQALFALASSDLDALRLSGGGQVVAFERGEQGMWRLTEPAGEEIEPAQAEALVSQVLGLRPLSQLAQAPPDEATGLVDPTAQITLRLPDGSEQILLVGAPNPTQSGYYARLDDGPVLILAKMTIDAILESLASPPVAPAPGATPEAGPGAGEPTVTP